MHPEFGFCQNARVLRLLFDIELVVDALVELSVVVREHLEVELRNRHPVFGQAAISV